MSVCLSDLESGDEGSDGSEVEINAPKPKKRKKEAVQLQAIDAHMPYTFKGKTTMPVYDYRSLPLQETHFTVLVGTHFQWHTCELQLLLVDSLFDTDVKSRNVYVEITYFGHRDTLNIITHVYMYTRLSTIEN